MSRHPAVKQDVETLRKALLTADKAKLEQLTSNELKSLSKDTKVYEGVGKMYATCLSVRCTADLMLPGLLVT